MKNKRIERRNHKCGNCGKKMYRTLKSGKSFKCRNCGHTEGRIKKKYD